MRRVALVALNGFVAVTAIGGGIALISGVEGDRFSSSLLEGTPFTSYFWPGLILAIVVGGSGATAAVIALVRPQSAAATSIPSGLVLIGWIAAEVLILRAPQARSWIEVLYLALGVAVLVLGFAAWIWSPVSAQPSKRIGFTVLAWTLSLFFGLLFVGTTILTIGTWLAGTNSATNPVTDLGFFALGGFVITVGVAVQLREPDRNVAGMQQALLGALVLAVSGLIGDRIEPFVGGLAFFFMLLLLAVVHPARNGLVRFPGHVSIPLAVLSAVAVIPAVAYAAATLHSAQNAGASCFLGRCAFGDRFAEMAALAVSVILISMLSALKVRGWMVSALCAGASAILVGLASTVLPDAAGSFGQIGGLLAIAWGVLFVVLARREATEARSGMEVSVQ